jgi:hypothetical protein
MGKECMMVQVQSLNKKLEKNKSTWMAKDFKMQVMWSHSMKVNKWKNMLPTLMPKDKYFDSFIWSNRRM